MKKFNAGDKVYIPSRTTKLLIISRQDDDLVVYYPDGTKDYVTSDGYIAGFEEYNPELVHATQKNRKLLKKLFGVKFEKGDW